MSCDRRTGQTAVRPLAEPVVCLRLNQHPILPFQGE